MGLIIDEKRGIFIADSAQIKQDVESEFMAELPNGFNLDSPGIEAALSRVFTALFSYVATDNAFLANQFNPDHAGGDFQDKTYSLTGTFRDSAFNSKVTQRLNGVGGTIVQTGNAIIVDDAGNEWTLDNDTTITFTGSVYAVFTCSTPGAIYAGIGTITTIKKGVLGWDTTTNEEPAIPGELAEDDFKFNKKRRTELGNQGLRMSLSIQGRLAKNVPGYKSHTFRENRKKTPQTIDGVLIQGSCVYVCVDGGTTADVATQIKLASGNGHGYTGNTEFMYLDTVSGQTELIKFDRPTYVPTAHKVTVRLNNNPVSTAELTQTIVDYSNGLVTNYSGLTVGVDVSGWDIASALESVYPGISVRDYLVAKEGQTPVRDVLEIAINQKATVITGNVEIILV